MRYPKVDKNQKDIVETLRECGMSVHTTHMVHNGFPDIVVGWCGYNFLLEIKSEGGKLTSDEKDFQEKWDGEYLVVFNERDAVHQIVRSVVNKNYQNAQLMKRANEIKKVLDEFK